jgi:hypothetical protein
MSSEGVRRRPIGAWSTAKSKINPPRIKRGKRAELLGNYQRRMVWQHNTPGTNADGLCSRRDRSNHDCRCCTGDARHIVVLGQPIAMITYRFYVQEIENPSVVRTLLFASYSSSTNWSGTDILFDVMGNGRELSSLDKGRG